jgi:hypothetical protein
MPIGYFLDKTQPPTPEELQTAMGSVFPLWQRLLRFIETNYKLPGELSYGGKNYGWNLWYRKSGKSLTSLFPQQNGFVAQVVLGREQASKAATLELGEKVRRLVDETKQLHDGKWLFIPVTDETDLMDVEKLLLLKRRPVLPLDKKS